MIGAYLLGLMTLLQIPPDDTAALVARLGSETINDREEAAKKLEAMGRDALPALVAAMRSPDSGVRSRVSPVWAGIQKRAMIEPLPVRIDNSGPTIEEVIRSIGKQGGFLFEVSRRSRKTPVNAGQGQSVPFWQAVEQLGLKHCYFDIRNPSGSHFPTLFVSETPNISYPSMVSGPFLIKLKALHERRDRSLIAGPWIVGDEMGQRIPIGRDHQEMAPRFFADLDLMIEPRMWFSLEDRARAVEAVDDLGQSLVPREAVEQYFFASGGFTEDDARLELAMPARPGRTIVKLRGVVPVALLVRWPTPAVEITLEGARGKSVAHEDATFTLQEFSEGEQWTTISFDTRLNLDRFELPVGHSDQLVRSRTSCFLDHQVEIVDAQGNMLGDSASGNLQRDGTGRFSFLIDRNRTNGRPARFRYYRVLRAFTEVPFEFRNIPML